ncbi:MAG: class I SAM-dependent methyltransferase [Acidimicrobiales bacterium]
MATYTFGHDSAAVERLGLVASAYEPVSRAFLARNARMGANAAVDLGCGPAFSTELLDEVCSPERLMGVDSSVELVDVARRRFPRATFVVQDLTTSPLRGAPADLMYARLLLAHLPDPLGTAERWRSELAPGGVLLVEDLEEIHAPRGPLRNYDEVSAGIVRQGGGTMYAGAQLAALGGTCAEVTVRAAIAARIYLFNVDRWIREPETPAPLQVLTELRAGLAGVVDADNSETVSWVVRQTVAGPIGD